MIVYRHIRLDKNEPFYIGIGKSERRAYSKHGRNKFWKRIVNKTKYRVEILFDDLTKEQAVEKEIELITLYGRRDLGTGTLVNMTDGGEGLYNPSLESRKKMSKASKGIPKSEAHKKRLSEIKKGKISPRKGVKLLDSTKQKLAKIFSKPITINGITYQSYKIAAKELNICQGTLRRKYLKKFRKKIFK